MMASQVLAGMVSIKDQRGVTDEVCKVLEVIGMDEGSSVGGRLIHSQREVQGESVAWHCRWMGVVRFGEGLGVGFHAGEHEVQLVFLWRWWQLCRQRLSGSAYRRCLL